MMHFQASPIAMTMLMMILCAVSLRGITVKVRETTNKEIYVMSFVIRFQMVGILIFSGILLLKLLTLA